MKIKVLSSNEDIQEVKTQWNINLINSHWSYATLNWILNWFNITFKLNEEFLKSLLPKASLSKYVTVLSSLTKNEAVLSFIYCGTSKKCIHYHLVIDISDSKFDFLRKHMTTQSLTGEWAGGYWIRYDEKDEFENEMLSLMIDICNVLEYNFIYGAITRKGAMIVHFDSEENEHYVQKFIPDSELHRISLQLDNEELINNSLFIEKDTE